MDRIKPFASLLRRLLKDLGLLSSAMSSQRRMNAYTALSECVWGEAGPKIRSRNFAQPNARCAGTPNRPRRVETKSAKIAQAHFPLRHS